MLGNDHISSLQAIFKSWMSHLLGSTFWRARAVHIFHLGSTSCWYWDAQRLKCSRGKPRWYTTEMMWNHWSLESFNVFPFSLWWMIWYSIPYDDRIPYDGRWIWCVLMGFCGVFGRFDKSLRTRKWASRHPTFIPALWGSAFSRHLSFSLMRAFPLGVLVLDLMLQGVLDRKLEIPSIKGYPPTFPWSFLVALCGCFRLVNPIYGSCTVESVPQDISNIL